MLADSQQEIQRLKSRVAELEQVIAYRDKIEEALRLSHDELEDLVAESTTELVQSEERWRSLVETAPDFILVLNPDASIRFINRTRPGYTMEQVIGSSGLNYANSEDHHLLLQCIETVMETAALQSLETSVSDPDGTVHWYSSRMGPFLENGKIVGVTCFATDITSRKLAEVQLKAEERLLRRLLNLHEKERQLIAHDIHDGFVQFVTGAKMILESVRYKLQQREDENLPQVDKVSDLMSEAISEARRMIGDLRPIIIDERGVVDAIKYLIADLERKDELSVEFAHEVTFKRLDPMLEGALFRIVQEALTNVNRHSGAQHASVHLTQQQDQVQLEIQDQGVGFDIEKVPADRFGIRGIRERARLFGGTSEIQSQPGAGTKISVQVPVATAD